MAARNIAVPEVTFAFSIDKLDIAELQQAIGTGTSKGGTTAGAPASPSRLSAKGAIDVGTILVSGVALSRVHSDVNLTNGVLALMPLTAEVFGGKETGGITVDMRSQPAKVALNTNLSEVDAQKLLAATTSLKQTLSGLLGAGLNATVSLSGAEMARTLNGNLNLQLKNGRLAGVNILNQLAGVAKFLGYRQNPQAYTDIVQLAGDLKVTNGVASTDNLRLQIDGGTLAGAGTMNLVTQALDLRITAMLDRAMSQKVGGTQIGGFLTTALANSNGELVIPAVVTGTFAQPRFMPDAGRVAEMKLKNLLPASNAVRSAAEKLTGVSSAPRTDNPPSAVRGVLGVFDRLRGKGQKSGSEKP
jgi:AsmA protein